MTQFILFLVALFKAIPVAIKAWTIIARRLRERSAYERKDSKDKLVDDAIDSVLGVHQDKSK